MEKELFIRSYFVMRRSSVGFPERMDQRQQESRQSTFSRFAAQLEFFQTLSERTIGFIFRAASNNCTSNHPPAVERQCGRWLPICGG